MDATCPKINFERVGCFGDKHQPLARPLPDYLFNDRDPSIDNFSGRRIEWRAWDIYLPEFACRCAEAAKKANHTFFGVQFYGKCKKPCIGVLFTAVLAFSRLLANLSCIGCGQNVSKKRLWQTLNLKSYLRGQITCPSDLCVHQGLFFWPHELISASKLLTVVLTQQFSMLVLFVLNSLSLSQRRVLEWPQRPYDLRHRWPTTRWLYQPVLPALCPTQQVLCRKKLWKLCV